MFFDNKEASEVIEEAENTEECAVQEEESDINMILEAKEAEIAELKEQLKRVAADAENYRKRTDASVERRIDGAKEDIFRSFLTVVDHLEMAVNAANNGGSLESLVQGMELVLRDALKMMESYNVSAVEAEGQPFDPSCHEAVMMEEREDLPDETVSMEFKKGYRIGDKLLRPSMVRVARQPK